MTFPTPTRGPGNRFTVEQVRAWNLAGEKALVEHTKSTPTRDRSVWHAKNTTGAALTAGQVVEVYQVPMLYTLTNRTAQPILGIRAAVATSRLRNAAVIVEPGADNKWVGFVTHGIVAAQVTGTGQVAVYDLDERRFKAAPAGGFELITPTAGVNLDRLRLRCVGKAVEDLLPATEGPVDVWENGASIGEIQAVNDWFGGGTITAGKNVGCEYVDEEQKWRIIGAECEDDSAAPGVLFTSPAVYTVDLGYPPKSSHKIDVPDISFDVSTMALAQQWGFNPSKPGYAASDPLLLIVEPYDGGYFLHVHCINPAAKIGGEISYCLVSTAA